MKTEKIVTYVLYQQKQIELAKIAKIKTPIIGKTITKINPVELELGKLCGELCGELEYCTRTKLNIESSNDIVKYYIREITL